MRAGFLEGAVFKWSGCISTSTHSFRLRGPTLWLPGCKGPTFPHVPYFFQLFVCPTPNLSKHKLPPKNLHLSSSHVWVSREAPLHHGSLPRSSNHYCLLEPPDTWNSSKLINGLDPVIGVGGFNYSARRFFLIGNGPQGSMLCFCKLQGGHLMIWLSIFLRVKQEILVIQGPGQLLTHVKTAQKVPTVALLYLIQICSAWKASCIISAVTITSPSPGA